LVCNVCSGDVSVPLYVHGADKKNVLADMCPVPAWGVGTTTTEKETNMVTASEIVAINFPEFLKQHLEPDAAESQCLYIRGGDVEDYDGADGADGAAADVNQCKWPEKICFKAHYLKAKDGAEFKHGSPLLRLHIDGETLPKRKRGEALPDDIAKLVGAVGMRADIMSKVQEGLPLTDGQGGQDGVSKKAKKGGFLHLLR
jgi:hypothetical protein